MVTTYIAQSEFMRDKFIEAGFTAGKIVVTPTFIHPDPGVGDGGGGFALFVGRLCVEKGLRTLLDAWRSIGERLPLVIVGDGPLAGEVRAAAAEIPGVRVLANLRDAELVSLRKQARFLILPSIWYEGMPAVIGEAYAVGLPIIASKIGSLATAIEDGHTGLHVRAGDVGDLIEKVEWIMAHPEGIERMRVQARAAFERSYTADQHYRTIVQIYTRAREGSIAIGSLGDTNGNTDPPQVTTTGNSGL
jgi:glycosyltransferase involved in cell wall biosynthesis